MTSNIILTLFHRNSRFSLCDPFDQGGNVTIQIDGDSATTLNTYQSGGTTSNQCMPNKFFTKSDLTEASHQITGKNG